MFNKILIANRGEIAVRIIRACIEMGIQTVAVYAKADKDALHVQLADEAICIGKDIPQNSYLNMENIISAAAITGADAIHPGFGFLSENAKFTRICEECGITFIGPNAEMIDALGDKAKAREKMIKAGVPVVPGSKGAIETIEEAKQLANSIGYPVMLKAASGGGGRGMRIVYEESMLEEAFKVASHEAKQAFGDERMYMEKYIVRPKHIEFQILGDKYGNVVQLGERDCSMQRRHQKVLEEAPSTMLTEKMRKEMGEAAIRAAKAVAYENAGTVEFVVTQDGKFYFIEMNTRIQVEHPVTEMLTGVDLIKEQIKIAAGDALNEKLKTIKLKGHAIECRINAENPNSNFRPCAGKIEKLYIPGGRGVRVDSAIYNGYFVPPFYDSMLAKVITYGETREEAVETMKRALGEMVVEGVDTNIAFQYELLHTKAFEEGSFDTCFIGEYLEQILEAGEE